MTEPPKLSTSPRALALDALRGLAILMMCLSGIVPEGLPNFMYHGYYPRFLPDAAGVWTAVSNPHQFRGADWPSFTWVDWVFPMFLFAMGAAFPLALGRRLDQGAPMWRIVLGVMARGVTLIGFAVYVKQIIPQFIESPTSPATWCMGLLGFALLFPVFARLPRVWGRQTIFAIRVAGVVSAIGFVMYLNIGDGDTFSFAQNDVIILLLAHMSIAGSLIWLVSRNKLWLRLVSLSVVYIAHHQAMHGGWAWLDPAVNLPARLLDLRWINTVLPWGPEIPAGLLDLSVLYNFRWYKFLFVVIPGTIIGDLLREQIRPRGEADATDGRCVASSWSNSRLIALAAVMAGLILVTLIGFQCHGRVLFIFSESLRLVTPSATWWGVIPLLAGGLALIYGGRTPPPRLIRAIYLWGAFWLILGLIAEPFEGGIKKGPPSTISYYLVSVSLSILLLGVFTIWIDVLGRRRGTTILVYNGQNPMLAYVGIRNLLAPMVALPLLAPLARWFPDVGSGSINEWIIGLMPATTWSLLLWSLVQTLLLATIVVAFTHARVVWRN